MASLCQPHPDSFALTEGARTTRVTGRDPTQKEEEEEEAEAKAAPVGVSNGLPSPYPDSFALTEGTRTTRVTGRDSK